jgi:hypothetical protein
MSAFSRQEAAAILGAYDFSAASTIVDVGVGQGALLAAILSAHLRARGILLDQDDVIARARAAPAGADGAERCTMVAGDFFAAVPEGGDIYMLKSVLHKWDDARSIAILERCRCAMHGDARVVPTGAAVSIIEGAPRQPEESMRRGPGSWRVATRAAIAKERIVTAVRVSMHARVVRRARLRSA